MDIELKKALLGYKVSEVHNYLEHIEKIVKTKMDQQEEKYKELEEKLAKERASAQDKQAALEQENASLKESLQAEKDRAGQLQDQLEKQEKEHKAQLAELKEENQTLFEHTKSFEKERASVSEALICAKEQAGVILEDARKEAAEARKAFEAELAQEREQAKKEMDGLKERIGKMTDELILLRSSSLKVVEKYRAELDYLISEFGSTAGEEKRLS